MILPDVNVLVYAFRSDTVEHGETRTWLEGALDGDEPVGIASLVLSGFLRVVTHPRIFTPPDTIESALSFADAMHSQPIAVPVDPGPRHWSIFSRLCREGDATGNLVPDAYIAALAIESGAELITTDRDYARFPGLRWRHPFR